MLAVIKALDPSAEEPYTLEFETGDEIQTKLPDPDIKALPLGACSVCDKEDCYEGDLTVCCNSCRLSLSLLTCLFDY